MVASPPSSPARSSFSLDRRPGSIAALAKVPPLHWHRRPAGRGRRGGRGKRALDVSRGAWPCATVTFGFIAPRGHPAVSCRECYLYIYISNFYNYFYFYFILFSCLVVRFGGLGLLYSTFPYCPFPRPKVGRTPHSDNGRAALVSAREGERDCGRERDGEGERGRGREKRDKREREFPLSTVHQVWSL